MTNQSINWIEETLWPRGDRRDIWMILDGARDRAIFRMLLECRLQYSCLYSGFLPPALEIAAPYLVQLEFQDRYTRRILERAWGNSWGIFLKCDLHVYQLRRHLRHFLMARDPRGRSLVFRYYDPRVLRNYLPTCFAEELRSLFGPIQVFWTESPVPEDMLEFRLQRGNLARRTLSLNSKKPSDARPPDYASDVQMPERYTTLTIRQAQLTIFSQIEVRKFEVWMLAHLQKFFPRRCKAAGDQQVQEMIQYGIKRAATYGITSKRDVCKYIDLMILFGRDFDTEKQSQWAGKILRQRGNSGARMQTLFRIAKQHLAKR